MKKIKHLIAISIFIVSMFFVTATAQVTTYTDSNSFSDNIPWDNIIFDSEDLSDGSLIFDGNSFNYLAFNYLIDDANIQVTNNFSQVSFNGANSLGMTGADKAFLSGDSLTIKLEKPSQIFGLYVIGSPGDVDANDFKLHFADAEVENSGTAEEVLADGGEVYFLGIIISDSNMGYSTAILESFDSNSVGLFLFNIDDMIYRGCLANLDNAGGVTFSDFAKFGLFWLDTDCNNCGGADLTGDSNVMGDDLEVLAYDWLCGTDELFPDKYEDISHSHIEMLDSSLSPTQIDGSDGNDFYPGTYFIYQTNEGRYGKFIVENLEKSYNNRLTVGWTTYNSDSSIHSSGAGLQIHGTYFCDLDRGTESGVTEADWHWNLNDSTTRSLNPYNGSRFIILYRADAP